MSKIKKQKIICECCDPGCPVHKGREECGRTATVKLRRIDFEGQPVCWFCKKCAEDAIESGVFG